MQLYVFVTAGGLLLSKRQFDADADPLRLVPCDTYLGPMSVRDTAQFLRDCYPDLTPSADVQVAWFIATPEETRPLDLSGVDRACAR
jgi:hypothetical protein